MSLKFKTIFLIIFISLISGCSKDESTGFCNASRKVYQPVTDHNARVVFDNRFGRYALDFEVATPGNIDTQIFGFPCTLDPQFQKDGLQVRASGTLKKFNSGEGFVAQTGGEELYFFEPSEIVLR